MPRVTVSGGGPSAPSVGFNGGGTHVSHHGGWGGASAPTTAPINGGLGGRGHIPHANLDSRWGGGQRATNLGSFGSGWGWGGGYWSRPWGWGGGPYYQRRMGFGGVLVTMIALMVVLPILFNPGTMMMATTAGVATTAATAGVSLTSMIMLGVGALASVCAGVFAVSFCCKKSKAKAKAEEQTLVASTGLEGSQGTYSQFAGSGLLDASQRQLAGQQERVKAVVYGQSSTSLTGFSSLLTAPSTKKGSGDVLQITDGQTQADAAITLRK